MEEQELTVLIYFASDNPLAPLVVSELKAIKDAGFQKDTTVLCLYDPMEKDAPTQLLDVNFKRREAKGTFIGDGADPYVRNMTEDQVDKNEFTKGKGNPTAAVTAFESLKSFIEFGLKKRTAKNYMLILLGHGMIVGNDTFLPDDDTHSAITLKQLKDLCGMFTRDNETSLRLLGLHSCSMSSIEVAYELKGKADYMLATQGTMFVNGWPYRQLLKKTFNQVKEAKKKGRNITLDDEVYDELIGNLYYLCLYNFTDFMTAGYSCDIALCRLQPENFERLKKPLQDLVSALKQGLPRGPSIIKDLILLAHWDAQSFWSENYTDLWDFCDCLEKRCHNAQPGHEIIALCQEVKKALAPENQGIVRHADNFGTEYQYARGLSIYFPWHRPFDDQDTKFDPEQCSDKQTQSQPRKTLQNYRCYDFTREFGEHHWLSFLETYWDRTERDPLKESEEPFVNRVKGDGLDNSRKEAGKIVYDRAKILFNKRIKRTPELKKSPDVGGDCTCPTIKNYPTTRLRDKDSDPKSDRNLPLFSITSGALGAFVPTKEGESLEPEDEDPR